MKWLAITFLAVLTQMAHAETAKRVTPLSVVILCAPYNTGEKLEEQYGEIGFLEGDAQILSPDPNRVYLGKIRLFLDPQDMSYTILFDIDDEASCFLTTGEQMTPIVKGDPL